MKNESEIRLRRDQLRETLSLPDPEFENDEEKEKYQAMVFFMQSHELLLSWVLGEDDRINKAFKAVEEDIKDNEL